MSPPRSRNNDPADPRARAIALLARREHGTRELKRKLEQRGIPGDEAERALAELAREGWQSDARYAEMLVRTRVSQGFGPLRIEAELAQAGVASEAARAALEQAGTDWGGLCAQVHAKRFGRVPGTSAERAKQYRYLQGRGFEAGHIATVLRGSAEDD